MAVTPEMLAVALGQAAPEPDSVTEKQWTMWIDDAEMLIDARIEKLAATAPSEKVRDYVVRQAVVAHIKKPDDATQVMISVDDGSSSRTYQSGKGRVVVLDEWWEMLGLAEADEGAFAIDMIGTASVHVPWCTLRMGGSYCSCGADIAGRPIYERADW